jgi:hypothetical protein
MPLSEQFFAFAGTLCAIMLVSWWMSRSAQMAVLRLTRSVNAAITAYYLLLLPGILLHEASHLVAARLLHLRVGKFSLGPKRHGKYVELGSVQVASGGALRDSIVGLAPFISGSLVLVAVGIGIFGIQAFGQIGSQAGWKGWLDFALQLLHVPDFWLWAYLVFVVSNAMIPSSADRRPWASLAIYLGCALIVAYFAGFVRVPAPSVLPWISGALHMLTLAFAVTLAVDLLAALVLAAVNALLSMSQR